MTVKEFKNIIQKEDNQIVVTQDGNGDIYVIDSTEMKVLAWVCGAESDHFAIYSGLSDRKSWNAINDFGETLPNERGLLQQVN